MNTVDGILKIIDHEVVILAHNDHNNSLRRITLIAHAFVPKNILASAIEKYAGKAHLKKGYIIYDRSIIKHEIALVKDIKVDKNFKKLLYVTGNDFITAVYIVK